MAVAKKKVKAKTYKLSPTEMISVEKRNGMIFADLCVEEDGEVESRMCVSWGTPNTTGLEAINVAAPALDIWLDSDEARDLYELLSVTKPWEKK